jgi:hypothetical protein
VNATVANVSLRLTQLIILFSTLTLSALAVAASTEAATANVDEINYAQVITPTEVVWLASDGGKFLSLQREYLAATERGVAILVPDLGSLPTATNGIEQLRVGLNDHGWTTISIMPPPQFVKQPSDDQVTSYSQRIGARINSAIAASKQLGGQLIVIVQGSQVSYLTKAYLDQTMTQPDALIILNGKHLTAPPETTKDQTPYPNDHLTLSSQITKLEFRVLDIYYRQDQLKKQMALRKKLSAKNRQMAYRQTELVDSDTDLTLVKTVYGWLKYSGLN